MTSQADRAVATVRRSVVQAQHSARESMELQGEIAERSARRWASHAASRAARRLVAAWASEAAAEVKACEERWLSDLDDWVADVKASCEEWVTSQRTEAATHKGAGRSHTEIVARLALAAEGWKIQQVEAVGARKQRQLAQVTEWVQRQKSAIQARNRRPSIAECPEAARPPEWGAVERVCDGQAHMIELMVDTSATARRKRVCEAASRAAAQVKKGSKLAVVEVTRAVLQPWREMQAAMLLQTSSAWAERTAEWQRESHEQARAWVEQRTASIETQCAQAQADAEARATQSAQLRPDVAASSVQVRAFRVVFEVEKVVGSALRELGDTGESWRLAREERCKEWSECFQCSIDEERGRRLGALDAWSSRLVAGVMSRMLQTHPAYTGKSALHLTHPTRCGPERA